MRRWAILYNGSNLLHFYFDTDSQTFTVQDDIDDADLVSENYDYFGNHSGAITVVKENEIESTGYPTPYTIPKNVYSRMKKAYPGIITASLILYKAASYEGIGGEILRFNVNNDPMSFPSESNNFSVIPAQFDATRDRFRHFEIGSDKLLLFKSYGYYILFNKHTATPIYFGRTLPYDDVFRTNRLVVSVNDSTILRWNSSGSAWEATKFLTEGPYLAYGKDVSGNALIANNLTKVVTDFNLVKGTTYYLSYEVKPLSIVPVISNTPSFAAKKLGVALDENTFYVDMQLNS